MKCWFDNDLSVLVIDGDFTDEEKRKAFELIHIEYIDLAGLYKNKEFEMLGYMNHLEAKFNVISMSIELQRKFLVEFDIPFLAGFRTFKDHGHSLYWDISNPDKISFLGMLNRIEARNKNTKVQLLEKKNELLLLQKNKVENKHTTIQSRQEFIRTLNALGKYGFQINKNETTVEELALMINDWQKEISQHNKLKK